MKKRKKRSSPRFVFSKTFYYLGGGALLLILISIFTNKAKPAYLTRQDFLSSGQNVLGKEEKKELRKAWAIKTAMYQRRRASEITPELSKSLTTRCDDVFRAELLLGYIAGIPWEQSDDESNSNQPQHS